VYTIRTKTAVNQGNTSTISGGTRAGRNLFHSFGQFSVLSGRTAYFNNAADIQNIISRVTGASVSNIDGLIKANGAANLFLLNPNGIIFGSNASLNIGGSFLASTASSLKFADGTKFSTTVPQSTPLLTVSVPIGLGIGSNPGSIRVAGTGYNLIISPLGTLPVIGAGSSLMGLRVQPGKTLALVGGDVELRGGILTVPGGRIELGSIDNGVVSLRSTPSGWTLGYQGVSNFKDTNLFQKALVDASGTGSGSIQVQGSHVNLTDGSLILVQNQGAQPGGEISVNAGESLKLNGISSDRMFRPGIVNENVGSGNGGDIGISTKNLILQDGAGIFTATYSAAKGGNLTVNAPGSVQSIGFSPAEPQATTSIGSLTFGSGNGGNIILSTGTFTGKEGGGAGTVTFGSGKGGDFTANVNNSVELIGVEPTFFSPSVLENTTLKSGDAGSLTLNTSKLVLRDGGRVDTSTVASGKAGSLTINASDSIEVSGIAPKSVNPSLIDSSANILDASLRTLYKLPPKPSGSPGDVTINTGRLSVTNGGLVSVQNQGLGKNSGTLRVNADSINLDNQGGITASTANGFGGDIDLHLANQLNLDHNSIISATAGGQGAGGNITVDPQTTTISNGSGIAVSSTGTGNAGQLKIYSNNLTLNNGSFLSANTKGGEGGNISVSARDFRLERGSYIDASALGGTKNGGNITLNSDTLEALDSSIIKANAFGGPGGNIQVNTQGLFRSPDSVVSASSTYGVNGTVQLNTLVNNSTLGIAFLPIVRVDPIRLIAPGCPANVGPRASQFIVTGSGGLPPSPEDPKGDETVVEDWRTASTQSTQSAQSEPPTSTLKDPVDAEPEPAQITEATGFETNAKGEIVGLVAQAPTYTPAIPWLQPTTCHSH